MEATPLEQEVVAVALKDTVEPTVLPFTGLLTVTPANADATDARKKVVKIAKETGTDFIMLFFSGWICARPVRLGIAEGSTDQAGPP